MDILPRTEYEKGELSKKDLNPDPFKQFRNWITDAEKAKIPEPYAFTLSTANGNASPSSRTVLLKGYDSVGLLFFTNYESRKGKEIEENPRVSALFYWSQLERQLLVEGKCQKLSQDLSSEYFKKRPRKAQITAWSSKQDQPIASRDALEEQYQMVELKFRGKEIPLPPYWGGYLIIPERFEFWTGRANRLHDRFEYKKENDQWVINRLSP